MKTFRLLTMAALAVFMCYFCASCNKDDNNADFSNQKKITKIKENSDNVFSLQYDDKGRLVKVTLVDENGISIEEYASFVWGDDIIERTDWPYTIYLENGLMQTSTMYPVCKYTYNNLNRIAKMEVNDAGLRIDEYIWDGDKLVRMTSDQGFVCDITYKETCKKGYSPIIALEIDYENYFLTIAHPELWGARTTQLPAKYIYGDTEETYSYEFDAEGYVSKVVISYPDGKVTYDLTWE